jgi:hypothetical protein
MAKKPKYVPRAKAVKSGPVEWSDTVSACEEHDTRSEEWGDKSFEASVVVRVATDERFALIESIRNGQRSWPWMSDAMFAGASMKPFAEKAEALEGDEALDYPTTLVTLKYSTTQFERFVLESIEPTVQFQVLDYRKFWWKNDDDTYTQLIEKESPGEQIRGLSYTVRFNNIFAENFDVVEYQDLIGKVNADDQAIKMLNQTFTKGQLLLLSSPLNYLEMPQSDEDYAANDAKHKWEYVLKYGIKNNVDGWNAYLRKSTQEYEKIYTTDDTTGAPYEYKNFAEGDITSLLPAFLLGLAPPPPGP